MRVPALLLFSALLVGCTTTGVRLTDAERHIVWQNHLTALNGIHRWSLRGRVALRADDRGWQASLRWVKSAHMQTIQLAGPFGSGRVSLQQDHRGAVLTDSRGNQYRENDAEILLQRITGWQLPVSGLQYWIRGQAIPDTAADVKLDSFGRLERLKQADWDIHYQAYVQHGSLYLPRRIFMSRPLEEDSDRKLEVRLVLNHWQMEP